MPETLVRWQWIGKRSEPGQLVISILPKYKGRCLEWLSAIMAWRSNSATQR